MFILENWWLRKGSRLREVVATGGSTVASLFGPYWPDPPAGEEEYSPKNLLNSLLPASQNPYPIQETNLRFCLSCGRTKDDDFFVLEKITVVNFLTNISLILTSL